MRALTIRQPWASLIAAGVKTLETRSWSTRYRGPLLIHAGKHRPPTSQWEEGPFDDIGEGDLIHQYGAWLDEDTGHLIPDPWWLTLAPDHLDYIRMPLGAVVAVADLVDVVPIVAPGSFVGHCVGTLPPGTGQLWEFLPGGPPWRDRSEEQPLGDFTPGRYAWLLDNVRPLATPVPTKGRRGLWTPDDELLDALAPWNEPERVARSRSWCGGRTGMPDLRESTSRRA